MTKWTLLQAAVWSVVLALPGAGCNTSNSTESIDPCLTALRINLEVGDAVIDEVEYEITHDDLVESITGVINTSAPGSTASVEQFGLPPLTGYFIRMEATSVDSS
ncbi:MAG: hypothetical protein JSU89_02375, partial [Myxococcales bacterium]